MKNVYLGTRVRAWVEGPDPALGFWGRSQGRCLWRMPSLSVGFLHRQEGSEWGTGYADKGALEKVEVVVGDSEDSEQEGGWK